MTEHKKRLPIGTVHTNLERADIIEHLSYYITNEARMPAGEVITVIEEIEWLREQNEILQQAVSEEGRANRMTDLYEKSQAEIERLRVAGDLLAVWVDHREACASMDADKRGLMCNCGLDRVAKAWEEARHG